MRSYSYYVDIGCWKIKPLESFDLINSYTNRKIINYHIIMRKLLMIVVSDVTKSSVVKFCLRVGSSIYTNNEKDEEDIFKYNFLI